MAILYQIEVQPVIFEFSVTERVRRLIHLWVWLINACTTYVRGVVSCVRVLVSSCCRSGHRTGSFFDVSKSWRRLRSRKKLPVVSFTCHFLEFVAVSMVYKRWSQFSETPGLVLTLGVQGPGRK